MSSSSSPSLVLELRRPWLRVLPVALLLLSACSLPWLMGAASMGTRGCAAILALIIAAVAVRQSGIGRPTAQIAVISWDQDQQWRLQFVAGAPITVTLSDRSWLSIWLMCLTLTAETGRRYRIMVWRGELSSVAWQQWQLRLRLDARPSGKPRIDGVAI